MRQAPIDPRRYPLAYALRARREREEAEIRAPVEAVLAVCQHYRQAAERALRSLEVVIGTKVGARVVERLQDSLARYCDRVVREAITEARARGGIRNGVVKLSLLENDLRFLDPKSIERAILDEWCFHAADRLEARADLHHPEARSVTRLVVSIPAMACARHIDSDIDSPRWLDGEKVA